MKTWIAVLCASALFLSLGDYATATLVFSDPHNGGVATPAAGDDRHGRIFETYGMTVDRVGNTFTFNISTDFLGLRNLQLDTTGDNQADVTWRIYYADLLFDTSMPTLTKNPDNSFNMTNFNPDFGVVFAIDGGGFGNPANPAPLTTLSAGFYEVSNTLTASQYKNSFFAAPYSSYNANYDVKIAASGSTFISALTSAAVPVSNLSNPNNDIPDKTITVSFTITDPAILSAFNDGFTAFWGTGTCGNDGVVAVVPVPPSLLLMGSGLFSMMGFTAARRFRSGGSRRKNG